MRTSFLFTEEDQEILSSHIGFDKGKMKLSMKALLEETE